MFTIVAVTTFKMAAGFQTLVLVFLVKSDSRNKIQVLLIWWFSVYCWHGNIDFPYKKILSNFNLGTISENGQNAKLPIEKGILIRQLCISGLWHTTETAFRCRFWRNSWVLPVYFKKSPRSLHFYIRMKHFTLNFWQ